LEILGQFILRVNIKFCYQFHFNISHRVKPAYLNFSVNVTEKCVVSQVMAIFGELSNIKLLFGYKSLYMYQRVNKCTVLQKPPTLHTRCSSLQFL